MSLFHVRQYRPNFFSGFENQVCRDVEEEHILDCRWFDNFRHEGFKDFTLEPYDSGETIIIAHYTDGKYWVAGFAIPVDHPFAKDWRYSREPMPPEGVPLLIVPLKREGPMLIKYDDEDGEKQNLKVEDYSENDDFIQITNLWHHDAEGVLIPRSVIQEVISALRDLQ